METGNIQFYFSRVAPKMYFPHYSRVVIILFNLGLYKFAFSIYSLEKLVFLSFWVFFYFLLVVYFKFDIIFKRCVYHTRCSVILFSLYKNYMQKQIFYHQNLIVVCNKNIPPEWFSCFSKISIITKHVLPKNERAQKNLKNKI